MATIKKIENITPIEGADKIECLKILGWQVVAEKGLHKVGDYVVYCEIDSWIPHGLAPFLSKGKEPKEYKEVKGERLKTIRLRGCLSQGLILPYSILIETPYTPNYKSIEDAILNIKGLAYNYKTSTINKAELIYQSNIDLSEVLNIQKWEAPIPAQLAGKVKGNFPHFIRKTDQERIQNVWAEYKEKYNDVEFEVSLKHDGTSFTAYYNNGEFGICSRNLELVDDNNSYWKISRTCKLEEILKAYGKNLAMQGELIGEGIQKNPENIKGIQLKIFDIYDINLKRHLTPMERWETMETLDPEGILFGCCPTMDKNGGLHDHLSTSITLREFKNIEDILKYAEGDSEYSNCREGLVFKSMGLIEGQVLSFKAISNKFLEKNQ